MAAPIQHVGEDKSNALRRTISTVEPQALRTFTPSQIVLSKSAGVFHFTPEGRRLYDYSSGVLVSNLGHNPERWMRRFGTYMGWTPNLLGSPEAAKGGTGPAQETYFEAAPLTAYNAITPIEALACERLLKNIRSWQGGSRLDTVMWAASGSEAVIKALWTCLHRDPSRQMILATRFGFHGKKGLAGAVTGSEKDHERDPRVRFISFPMDAVDDVSRYGEPLDLAPYKAELDALWTEHGKKLACLITEPYLGGGGSYHPPAAYLQMLQDFCREHDLLFILDEVQANFGRTGKMFAFEKYGLEPDFVVLGKGLGNGVPVAAVVGRGDIMAGLKYGEASDTWSANPLACAAVLATLDEFEGHDILGHTGKLTPVFIEGLNRLKETGLIERVRGEGLVFGLECNPLGSLTAEEVAQECVKAAYLGQNNEGVHFLGALAGKVLRVSPPHIITLDQAEASLDLVYRIFTKLAEKIQGNILIASR